MSGASIRPGGKTGPAALAGLAPDALAPTFAALGDPTRLKLVSVLCDGAAHSISDLTEVSDISRQGVTKHLNVLAAAGIVRSLKVGRESRWQLEGDKIEEAQRTLASIGREWEQALGRFKRFVEKDD